MFDDSLPRQIDRDQKVDQQCVKITTTQFVTFKPAHFSDFFLFEVLIKKDFPYASVPVPRVNYVNDSEPQISLKCSFDFPKSDNVSFKVQWFVNGKGVTPTIICDNPNESTCNRRDSLLGPSEYKPGDTVTA